MGLRHKHRQEGLLTACQLERGRLYRIGARCDADSEERDLAERLATFTLSKGDLVIFIAYSGMWGFARVLSRFGLVWVRAQFEEVP